MPDYYNFSPKLEMWYVEATQEKNSLIRRLFRLRNTSICHDFALYPRRFYKTVAEFDHTKTFDYCFIGTYKIDARTQANRQWILNFISSNFSDCSYLQFTDKKSKQEHKPLGCFDYTLEREGFVPKETPVRERNFLDEHYFRQLAKSKFTLCPAGDKFWSMRFYEALMCKSIPIVNDRNETFRSRAEARLNYRYYLTTDNHEYREDWAEHNYRLFLKHHTLEYAWW